MTKTKALVTLLTVIPTIVVYVLLARALGLREAWAGYLFITVWAMVEDLKVERLPLTLIGGELGIAIGTMPIWLAPAIGPKAALIVMILAILAAIYALLMQWLPILVNKSTMIFLTAATIPQVVAGAAPAQIALGAAYGALYFGALIMLSAWAGRLRNPVAAVKV